MFSLGDAETQNKFLKCVKVVKYAVKMYQNLHYNGFFRFQFFVKNVVGVHTMERNRFYSENKVVKRGTNCRDDSAMLLYRLL